MNVLRPTAFRQTTRLCSRRVYTSTRSFVSTAIRHEEPRGEREKILPIPQSPSFYTTRAVYYDQTMHLEKAISRSETFLRQNYLLPLPDFAKASLPPLQPVWKDKNEMASEFKTKMTTTRYRKVTKLLNQLLDFKRIASVGGCPELAEKLDNILAMYESSKKEALLARGKRKPTVLDEYGRSYSLGKRKTASARVWMIPVKQVPVETPETMLGLEHKEEPITTSMIIVNNLRVNEFFTIPADRERITRPLKVAGALGKYNVFAIVRGGGTSGQSGALAHGIAKGIVAHEPALETMFRRAKLTRRDPRMVERKKTGLAKARKRYTWVKR